MKQTKELFNSYGLLFILLVISVFVRSYGLSGESIYGDEAYSIFHAQKPLKELLPVFLTDQNPPLHLFLLHFWLDVFGVSGVSAKAFSVLCSVLAGMVLFLFAKKYLGKTAAILVSVLFLLSNAQQFFATEVRPYAMIQLFAISSFFVYFKILQRPEKKYIFLLLLTNLLLLFSHYLTIYIFIVQFIGAFFFLKQNKKGFLYYVISQALTVLAFLPWLKVLLANIPKTGSFWNEAPKLADLRWHVNILNGNERLFNVFSVLILCSLIMLLLNKKHHFYNPHFRASHYFIFLLLYVLPVALDFYVAQFTPVFLSRYILYSTFGLFLFTGYFISYLDVKTGIKALTFIPLLYVLLTTFAIKQEREDDWKSMVSLVKEQRTPHSVIFISASYKFKDFAFYYDPEAFKDPQKTLERLAAKGVYCSAKDFSIGWNRLNYDTISKIIYIQSHSQFEDPEEKIKAGIIAHGFKLCDFYRKVNIAYSVFVRDSLDCHTVVEGKQSAGILMDGFISTTGFMDGFPDAVFIYKADAAKADTISKDNPFGMAFSREIRNIAGIRKVYASVLVSGEKEAESRLVFSIEKNGKSITRNEIMLSDLRTYSSKKETIFSSFIIPPDLPIDAELKIYSWNPGATPVSVESLKVILQKGN